MIRHNRLERARRSLGKPVVCMLSLSMVMGLTASAFAQPQAFDITCHSNSDIRQILVVAPGQVGKACDVLYARDRGLTTSTPYHANGDLNFCYEKAASLRDKLIASNYRCEGAGTSYRVSNTQRRVITQQTAPAQTAVSSSVLRQTKTPAPTPNKQPDELNQSQPAPQPIVLNVEQVARPELSQRDAFLNALKAGRVKAINEQTEAQLQDKKGDFIDPEIAKAQAELRAQQGQGVQQTRDVQEPLNRSIIAPRPQNSPEDKQISEQKQPINFVPASQRINIDRVDVNQVSPALTPVSINEDQGARIHERAQQESPADRFAVAEQNNISQQKIANREPMPLSVPSTDTILQNGTVSSQDRRSVRATRNAVASGGKLVGATPVVHSPVVSQVAQTRTSQSQITQDSVPSQIAANSVTQAVPSNDQILSKAANIGIISSIIPAAQEDRPRSRSDIIKATLAAQAAAWNEGDIEAFMEGYWRDKDLTFVSGTQVSKGWGNTLKRYKKRYGNGAQLGQLSFEELDVQMVADDVAIVVGRFILLRDQKRDSGLFTLVMKRFEGVWRIVHDHTVGDPEGDSQ